MFLGFTIASFPIIFNYNVSRNLRDGFPYPYTLDNAVKWIDMVLDNKIDLILALEINGEAAGGIGIHGMKDVYRYNAELGYWLAEIYWGKGILTGAVQSLVSYAFNNFKWHFLSNIFNVSKLLIIFQYL